MSIKIIFETHSTSIDNEACKSSGHYDVGLSGIGYKQAKLLGQRYKDIHLDAVYCSDLQRSYKTGELAFNDRNIKLVKDSRLRECDYGDLTRVSTDRIISEKVNRISKPFPNGESYEDCLIRVKSFLVDVLKNHKDNDIIMIIGHRATQYGLNHWILDHSIEKCVTDLWEWQPGWCYELEKLCINKL